MDRAIRKTLPLALGIALVALATTASMGSAQEPAAQDARPDTLGLASPAPSPAYLDMKSESKALRLSALGTLIPGLAAVASAPGAFGDSPGAGTVFVTAGAFAVLVGPSLGHFYAGRPGRAWLGIGLRCAGAAGFIGAVAASFPSSWNSGSSSGADGAAVCALALIGGSMIYDIGTAARSARVHNAKLGAEPGAKRLVLAVVPTRDRAGAEVVASVRF
jgi:hypothetical protein